VKQSACVSRRIFYT